MEIHRLGPADMARLLAAAHLFDEPPRPEWAERFLTTAGHHLLMATVDGMDVGFVTGVETTHPDKGTELFLYELGVDARHRREGVARALVVALADLARERSCYGMWVATEPDNAAALATYRSAGAEPPEPSVTLTWTFDPG